MAAESRKRLSGHGIPQDAEAVVAAAFGDPRIGREGDLHDSCRMSAEAVGDIAGLKVKEVNRSVLEPPCEEPAVRTERRHRAGSPSGRWHRMDLLHCLRIPRRDRFVGRDDDLVAG